MFPKVIYSYNNKIDNVENTINKTIYLTYKKEVPDIVLSRWKELNKDYNIELSLDIDCINFLEKYFNNYIVDLFKKIPVGMYKADLWRLCKLYVHGGVYADIDLVPHISIDTLDKNVTFYSCLSVDDNYIFQAFMVNFSYPKNPLILHFLISFLLNNPQNNNNGPCADMYNCIKHNLNGINIQPNIKYEIEEIMIPINIGSSNTNIKHINLYYFPNYIKYHIKLNKSIYNDTFSFDIIDNILIVTRIDANSGWGHNHSCNICIKSKETIFLFKEKIDNNNFVTAYVSHNNTKILDSRDMNYYYNKGW